MGLEGTRELSVSVQGAGRRSSALCVTYVRELTEADLALLRVPRGTKPRPLARLRDRHHSAARLLAMGLKEAEVSSVTGYDLQYLSILKADPAFQACISHYKEVQDSAHGEFVERATLAANMAVAELSDRLENAPEAIDHSDLLETIKVLADRSGHAPVSKSVSIAATVDYGSRLARAREKVVEGHRNATG